jgi:hypothetical protein
MECPNPECRNPSGEVVVVTSLRKHYDPLVGTFVEDGKEPPLRPALSYYCVHCFSFLGSNEVSVKKSLGIEG